MSLLDDLYLSTSSESEDEDDIKDDNNDDDNSDVEFDPDKTTSTVLLTHIPHQSMPSSYSTRDDINDDDNRSASGMSVLSDVSGAYSDVRHLSAPSSNHHHYWRRSLRHQRKRFRHNNFDHVKTTSPQMVVLSQPMTVLGALANEERTAMEVTEIALTQGSISMSESDREALLTFYREIKTIISAYLSLVHIQRTLNNYNTNSSNYPEGMVKKILSIIRHIPRHEMSMEKYHVVCRDALFLYYTIITRMTGPKHSKRLRTPYRQFYFCGVLAMLVNDVPVASDLTVSGKETSLVQFASAVGNPAYQTAVHDISSVYNSSYSVYKALGLSRSQLTDANMVLAIISAHNTQLSDRKPRTMAQGALLYRNPELVDRMRASGLVQDESSLGSTSRAVAAQLRIAGVSNKTIDDASHFLHGSYNQEGITLKCFGSGQRDLKTVASSVLVTEDLRRRIRTTW
uniref:Wsv282-like protein n=1 Tax=Penaeus monodon endogenous nimavirus TaxID=2133795 RepID=A0A401IPH3_9VIRU|nr:MAG: wsv282-like protein [Penaeus monodon endogenous nimavirus]GBG35507.1 wsv282-like protein [Penaeus monodon endogenous nimavirus]